MTEIIFIPLLLSVQLDNACGSIFIPPTVGTIFKIIINNVGNDIFLNLIVY